MIQFDKKKQEKNVLKTYSIEYRFRVYLLRVFSSSVPGKMTLYQQINTNKVLKSSILKADLLKLQEESSLMNTKFE